MDAKIFAKKFFKHTLKIFWPTIISNGLGRLWNNGNGIGLASGDLKNTWQKHTTVWGDDTFWTRYASPWSKKMMIQKGHLVFPYTSGQETNGLCQIWTTINFIWTLKYNK